MSFQQIYSACLCGFLVAAAALSMNGLVCAVPPQPRIPQEKRPFWEQIAQQNEKIHHYTGQITGRVLLEDGKPAAGFTVTAWFAPYRRQAAGEGETVTDASGNYRLHGLSPEAFLVQVENGDRPYLPPPGRTIYLAAFPHQKAANVDFTLASGPKVTVRVHNAETGTPISNMVVSALLHEGDGLLPVGETDTKGEFVFRANRLDVRMELSAEKLQSQRIDAAPGYEFSKFLQLPKADAVVWEVKTYKNDVYYPRVTFRGLVTDVKGEPVSGASVQMVRDLHLLTTATDRAGKFAFQTTRIAKGEVRGAMIRVEKKDLRTIVFPTAEQTWGVIPVRLQAEQGGTVFGQVTDVKGFPISGVLIEYKESIQLYQSIPSCHYLSSVTDARGKFIVHQLSPEADYQFRFGGTSSRNGMVWGKTSFPDAPASWDYLSNYLHFQNGETRDFGRIIIYPADAVVAGRIVRTTNTQSDPGPVLYVLVRGEHALANVGTDANGNFRIEHLVHEPLTLSVREGDWDRGKKAFITPSRSPRELYSGTVRAGDTNVQIVVR